MRRMVGLVFVSSVLVVAGKTTVQKPQVDVPASFRNQGSAVPYSGVQWWKSFGDPLLDELMDRASTANLDVRKAAARLTEAEALRGNTKSSLLPSLDSSTSTSRLRGGFNQGVVRVPNAPGAPQNGTFGSPFGTSVRASGFTIRC